MWWKRKPKEKPVAPLVSLLRPFPGRSVSVGGATTHSDDLADPASILSPLNIASPLNPFSPLHAMSDSAPHYSSPAVSVDVPTPPVDTGASDYGGGDFGGGSSSTDCGSSFDSSGM